MNTLSKIDNKNNDIKDTNISFRCTSNEKTLIYNYAKRYEMSIGDFIINKCLKEQHQWDIQYICEMQTLINKFQGKQIKKKEFIDKAENLLGKMKWH